MGKPAQADQLPGPGLLQPPPLASLSPLQPLLILILKFELGAKGKNCLPSNWHITRLRIVFAARIAQMPAATESWPGPKWNCVQVCVCELGPSALERRTNAPATVAEWAEKSCKCQQQRQQLQQLQQQQQIKRQVHFHQR